MPDKPVKPMLAKETGKPFDDPQWIFGIKWDGYRAIAEKKDNQIALYSRNGNSFNQTYPLVVQAISNIPGNCVIDGEIVVLNEEGKPSFQLLQHYSENQFRPIQFQVFDLLEYNGENLKGLPLIERKKRLKEIIPENDVIRYCEHLEGNGIGFFQAAKESDLEGIIAKKADSKYFPGKRISDWLKIKNHKSIEAIIAGYTEPSGSRKFFGALILAEKKNGRLVYIGHTGTGFNDKMLKDLYKMMQPLRIEKSPFDQKINTRRKVYWVEPRLVCEIKFTEFTKEGIVRHPVFLRLRDDKNVAEINFEPEMKTVKTKHKTAPQPEPKKILSFGKNKVEITNPDKIYFPKERIKKGEVADYYQSMQKFILPYLKDRPESLLRHPNGIEGESFFQKDAGGNAPSFVKTKKLFSESTHKDIDYIVCNNASTLAYMNNLGCIEINPWHSTIDKPDHPDYFMIDIDPSEKNTFDQVVEVAQAVKEVMDKAGGDCYCKTSGATGMHVYVPVQKKYNYEQVKDFANLICMFVNEMLPGFTTLEHNLKKRGNKKIYLDYLQNRRGQTLACVYSLRPKPGATVSTPLKWDEVKKGISPKDFTMFNIRERVERVGDLFSGVLKKGIDMEKCIERLNG